MWTVVVAAWAWFSINFCSVAATHSPLKFLGAIPVTNPAFLIAVESAEGQKGNLDLLISSFGVSLFGPNPDQVHVVSNISEIIRSGKMLGARAVDVGQSISWPNELSIIDDVIYAPGGFLVPGKRGHIARMNVSDYLRAESKWTEMVSVDKGFFHRIQSINLLNNSPDPTNNSGNRLVSCRGWKGTFGGHEGEMVYFDPSEAHPEMHHLAHGCDVFFATIDINHDGILEFIVPVFFGSQLQLMWTEHPDGDYTKPEFIRTRVIDENVGAAFDVEIVDVDGDGKLDILATNHQSNRANPSASVFVYEINVPSLVVQDAASAFQPKSISDFMNQVVFERHTISKAMPVISRSFAAAAPGSARAVFPRDPSAISDLRSARTRPVVVVSGDDAQKAFLLEHVEGTRWQYTQSILHDCGGTVGAVATMDVDGDGWMEVFVPCYTKNYVAVYTFSR